MGEFVFPETIKRIGWWDEWGGGEGKKKKEQKKEKSMKLPKQRNDNMTLIEKLSHNHLSLELSGIRCLF